MAKEKRIIHLVTGAADNGWEDGARGVISGESSLAHTGSVVNNQRCYFIVAHFVLGEIS